MTIGHGRPSVLGDAPHGLTITVERDLAYGWSCVLSGGMRYPVFTVRHCILEVTDEDGAALFKVQLPFPDSWVTATDAWKEGGRVIGLAVYDEPAKGPGFWDAIGAAAKASS